MPSTTGRDCYCFLGGTRQSVVLVGLLFLIHNVQKSTAFAFHSSPSRTTSRTADVGLLWQKSVALLSSAVSSPGDARDGDAAAVSVALTREDGKNGKLLKALLDEHKDGGRRIRPVELPCIEHADGPDYDRLADTLESEKWDYVAVTSPEAARVLASVWDATKMTSTPGVAAVGKATEKVLEERGIPVAFCPSKATAKVLCRELPGDAGCRVLYPASLRAQTTLQDGLRERGFDVTRLNTYDTVTATWNQDAREKAAECRIACFASPSAIQGWLNNAQQNDDDDDDGRDVMAACIGETSAEACRKQGWAPENVFHPDKPGIEGWVEAVEDALESLAVASHP